MTSTLLDVLDADDLATFDGAGAIRHGLPPGAYTEERFLRLEQDRLFPNSWTFAGFAHELPDSGDVCPIHIGGQPVLLVRNREGSIKAFHNICSHRCAMLVREPGHAGQFIRCPYHCWVYGLDGSLRATPHFGGPNRHVLEGYDPRQHGLKEICCSVWHDWIFVNVNGTAETFEDYVAPLAARLEGIDFDQLEPIAVLDFGEVECNWKLLMENFIEPYHVQYVHATTTDQPLLDHYTIVDGHCLGSAVDITRGGRQAKADTLSVSSRFLTLFPNFVLGWYHPDQLGVHLNIPVAVDKTHQRRILYHYGDQALSAEAIAALKDLWFKVHKEDHAICERLQAGRASSAAGTGGVLSPHWEKSVRQFQELLINALR